MQIPPTTQLGIVLTNATNGVKNESRIAMIAVRPMVETEALPVIATQPTLSP